MNAATDREMTSFWCKVASVHADRALLPVIFDLILNPLMDPAEMEKEREVILDELRMTNGLSRPSVRPAHRPRPVARPGHGPGRGRHCAVGDRHQPGRGVSRYMERQYRPNNTVIGMAGAIGHDEAVRFVADATADWAPGESLTWQPVSAPPGDAPGHPAGQSGHRGHQHLPGAARLRPERSGPLRRHRAQRTAGRRHEQPPVPEPAGKPGG